MSNDKKEDSKQNPDHSTDHSENNEEHHSPKGAHMTSLSVKDEKARNETEGERRFKEGLANNSGSEE